MTSTQIGRPVPRWIANVEQLLGERTEFETIVRNENSPSMTGC